MVHGDSLLLVAQDDALAARIRTLATGCDVTWLRTPIEARRFASSGMSFVGTIATHPALDGCALELLDFIARSLGPIPALVIGSDFDPVLVRELHARRIAWVPGPCEQRNLQSFLDRVDDHTFSRGGERTWITERARPEELTRSEWSTLDLYLAGRSVAEISAAHVVSEATVKTHLAHATAKCGFERRSELVQALHAARRRGELGARVARQSLRSEDPRRSPARPQRT